MPLDPSKIYDLATDLLDCVVAGMEEVFDDYLPAIVLPDRQYVHAGEVAWDCPAVTVTVPDGTGVTHAMPGGSPSIAICAPPRHVHLQVSITRCVPIPSDNGDPPTVEALDAAARLTLTDLWTLAYVLWDTYRDGCWGGSCASVMFGDVVVVGPQGGHTAVVADVFVLVT